MFKKLSSVVLSTVLLFSLSTSVLAAEGEVEQKDNAQNISKQHQDYQGTVKVDNVNLYVNVQGSANRSKNEPAVVFESGREDSGDVWSSVQTLVSDTTQTFSYDRASLGQSEDTGGPYDAVTQAKQLHKALQKAKVKAPYILVTHSYGSAISYVFDNLYPNQVAGVVLVDGAHVLQEQQITETLLPAYRDIFKSKWTLEGGYTQIVENLAQAQVALANDNLRNVPLKVLSGTEHGLGPEVEAAWATLQTDLLNLSNFSSQTIVQGSSHYIMIDAPDAVASAIEEIL